MNSSEVVVSRNVLICLVYTFVVLIVAFAVMMGGYALLGQTNDTAAANVFFWLGATCLALFILDTILLVGALGINAISQRHSESDR